MVNYTTNNFQNINHTNVEIMENNVVMFNIT